jgi:peptidoglycan/LPS O-acetylase OafA/YrhL
MHVAFYHLVRPHTLWGPFRPIFQAGYIGVSFFFMLSGFILTYSHAAEYESGLGSLKRFWIARFARIYPVYLVSLLFAVAVGGYHLFHQKIHILAFIADLVLLQTWSIRMVPFFHITAWSLSVEVFFYFVFPFVLLRLKPSTSTRAWLSLAAMWLLAIAVPLLCLWLYPDGAWHETPLHAAGDGHFLFRVRRLPILLIPQFFAGIVLGWIFLRFRPKPRTAAILTSVGIAGLFTALMLTDHLPFVVLHNGLLIPFFAFIVLGLSEPSWLARLLSTPFLVLLGEASYALYLVHFIFNDWMKNLGAGSTIPSALWKLALIIPLSIALHVLVERPFRRLILIWWKRRHTSAPHSADLHTLAKDGVRS